MFKKSIFVAAVGKRWRTIAELAGVDWIEPHFNAVVATLVVGVYYREVLVATAALPDFTPDAPHLRTPVVGEVISTDREVIVEDRAT